MWAAAEGHAEVGETAAALEIDQLITIGELGAKISEAAKAAGLDAVVNVATTEQAAERLAEITSPGDLVLIKGSRSARTELVLEAFSNQPIGLTR